MLFSFRNHIKLTALSPKNGIAKQLKGILDYVFIDCQCDFLLPKRPHVHR